MDAFVPHPLPPPNLDLAQLAMPLAKAAAALGELNGVGRGVRNPYLLIRPFQRQEAVSSSKIEGTVSTLGELLLFEAAGEAASPTSDTREVMNYVRALESGVANLAKLPLSLRSIREAHGSLMEGVREHRGAKVEAGEFRRFQNWIGPPRSDITQARFVPPPPGPHLDHALDALEKYFHDPMADRQNALIRAALIHCQFEMIHPFADGNGRVGRIMIPLFLMEKRAITLPLLYLSPYIENEYRRYVDLLLAVSRDGAWNEWVGFFLAAVETTCVDMVGRLRELQDLAADLRARLMKSRSSILCLKLLDHLFERPGITVGGAQQVLGVTYRAAEGNIQKLVAAGILRLAHADRPKIYIADPILKLVSRPPASAASQARP